MYRGIPGKYWRIPWDLRTTLREQLVSCIIFLFLSFGAAAPEAGHTFSFMTFPDHTQRRTTDGRTPLNEWLARRRGRYLTHNTRDRHPAGIRTHNLSRRAAADLRLRPRGHWDRHCYIRQRRHTNSIMISSTGKEKLAHMSSNYGRRGNRLAQADDRMKMHWVYGLGECG